MKFAITWGNHDDEQGVSREKLQKYVEQKGNNQGIDNKQLIGNSDYVLTVLDKNNEVAQLLYCFDSHTDSQIPSIGGYDFIKNEQIAWYLEESKKYNTSDVKLPALAFFHIPLPEYRMAANDEGCKLLGNRWEKVCAPQLNSGLFSAMLTAGDIMGVFVEHDHDNDYIVNYKGIALAYGRYSGGNTVYNNLPSNGARVIELTAGKREFDTWIRLSGGDKINFYHHEEPKKKKE